ncbi:MAG: FecR family protein [Thermodesulfobacteriota bacterium]
MKPTCSKILVLSLAIFFLLLSIGGETSVANASAPVAIVKNVNGSATVVRQGQNIPATNGIEVWENDTIRTGHNGTIAIVFKDDTFLSLGPGSVLIIDEFVFVPKQGKFSIVVRMLKGTAAYLSGLISKLSPDSAHFKTPTASIGIRGTKFVAKVEGE